MNRLRFLGFFIFSICIMLTLNSCKKVVKGCMDSSALNYNSNATVDDGSCKYTTHSPGESFGGGLVFYVDGTGRHGLISVETDQSTGIAWGLVPYNIVSNAT